MVKKPKIISFESVDCAGKTTQIKKLYDYLLTQNSQPVFLTKQPSNLMTGKFLYDDILKDKTGSISTVTQVLSFMLDRSYHIDTVLSKISEDSIILIDRYIDSSVVYQSIVGGFDRQFIDDLNDLVTKNGSYKPDLTIVLDIDPVITMGRLKKRKNIDSFEEKGYDFHKKVQLGYQQLAITYPHRVKLINANQSIDKVFEDILQIVKDSELVKI